MPIRSEIKGSAGRSRGRGRMSQGGREGFEEGKDSRKGGILRRLDVEVLHEEDVPWSRGAQRAVYHPSFGIPDARPSIAAVLLELHGK